MTLNDLFAGENSPRLPLAVGAVGVAVLIVLMLTGQASPVGAVAAGAAVCGAALAAAAVAGRLGRRADEPGPDIQEPGGATYALLLERLPEPVMLVAAADGGATPRLTFANAAARELFPIQALGGPVAAAIRHPAALEVIEEALRGEASETELVAGGAQDRAWRVLGRPLPGAAGAQALVVLHDETDVRRAERMRADFLANASHELRTPLASLTGFIETLQGPARDDAAARARFLGIMGEQAARMGRLINDLLSLSRIELNEHIAPDGVVDMSAVVRDVLDAAAPPTRKAIARMEHRLPPIGEALVRGDRDQLIQVAQNLIDNAAKYAGPDGAVTIEVQAGVTADDAATARNPGAARLSLLSPDHAANERYVVLRVGDNGPGIARENLPRLSERFYRVEGQKSGERSGTGLGLAIVKHITNRHKGGLMVESAPGEGTTFAAYVPAAPVEPA
jgi:two-component system, OmpR family, phosphate regulon sensor histidine kinase PhoR